MINIRQGRSPWLDVMLCSCLILILLTHIRHDSSPWRDPFYDSARFDGQLGVAGNYMQAALGYQVDCLAWPCLPNVAMGGLMVNAAGFGIKNRGNERVHAVKKKSLYAKLDQIGRLGNMLAFVGVALWVVFSYFLLLGVFQDRVLAFLPSAYLASSQIAATQIGWLRPEVWSLTFLVLGFLMLLPDFRQWIWNLDCPPTRHELLRVFLAGFFSSTALLEKINVAPAVIMFVILVLVVFYSKTPQEKQLNKATCVLLGVLPVLLLPWWAFVFPDQLFWKNVSHFDADTVSGFSIERWNVFIALLTCLAAIPILGITTSRVLFMAHAISLELFRKVDRIFLLIAGIISGGFAALILWCALISQSFESYRLNVTHILSIVGATFFGVNPYAQTKIGINAAITYIWHSGAALSRPNLFDFLSICGINTQYTQLLNVTSVTLFMGAFVAIFMVLPVVRNVNFWRASSIGYLFFGLMMVSEYLSAKRGVFSADFRYYAYGGWFGVMAIAFFSGALIFNNTNISALRSIRITVVLLSLILILFDVLIGVSAASQNALFGRQIFIASQMCPNLFHTAGVVAESADWHLFLEWKPLAIFSELELIKRKDAVFSSRFTWSTPDENSVKMNLSEEGVPQSFQMKTPVSLDQYGYSGERSVVIRALLQSSHPERMPAIGLAVEDKITGKVVSDRWALISSAWVPGTKPEEYACEVRFDPRKQKIFFKIYWGPKDVGENILIQDLEIGTPIP